MSTDEPTVAEPLQVALTIAGSDSGGGAGIQADLAAFARGGVWGTSAITCVTAQSPAEVARVEPMAPSLVVAQIAVVCRCFPVAAIKIGMTFSAEIIAAIAAALTAHARGVPVVLDPVMRATSGGRLLAPGSERALAALLLPLATVVTPNLPEAEVLAEMSPIGDVAAMERAARRIAERCPGAVIVKGGHLEGQAIDVLLAGGRISHLTAERVAAPTTHGTGCSFSAALAAGLARGASLAEAAARAKADVTAILRGAVSLGPDGPYGLGLVGGRR